MLVKKENTEFNPNLPESHDNLKHVEIKDRQGINDEFHRAFQKIYAKQENVDDSSEAIQDFLNSGNDTMPSVYISNVALSDAERDTGDELTKKTIGTRGPPRRRSLSLHYYPGCRNFTN